MGATASSSLSLEHFHAGPDFDAVRFGEALDAWSGPLHLCCSPPFLVSWYNRTRRDTASGAQCIEAPDSAVAYALYSVPGYLDTVVEHFARERPEKDYVDAATNEILARLKATLRPELEPFIVNTDEGPPYYHVQTVGAVSGVDQHMEADDLQEEGDDAWREDVGDTLEDQRDPKMWGTDPVMRRKIFGVNIHPVWGGWYAYRALIVLRGVSCEALEPPAPLKILAPADMRRILGEYNLRHEECLWRDHTSDNPPERRYNPDEYLFFMETSPAKRRRFLEMRAAQFKTKPQPRFI